MLRSLMRAIVRDRPEPRPDPGGHVTTREGTTREVVLDRPDSMFEFRPDPAGGWIVLTGGEPLAHRVPERIVRILEQQGQS